MAVVLRPDAVIGSEAVVVEDAALALLSGAARAERCGGAMNTGIAALAVLFGVAKLVSVARTAKTNGLTGSVNASIAFQAVRIVPTGGGRITRTAGTGLGCALESALAGAAVGVALAHRQDIEAAPQRLDVCIELGTKVIEGPAQSLAIDASQAFAERARLRRQKPEPIQTRAGRRRDRTPFAPHPNVDAVFGTAWG
jgi:hypothetical protein